VLVRGLLIAASVTSYLEQGIQLKEYQFRSAVLWSWRETLIISERVV
jgi:hypothetical protein